ncbi:hypothetical protein [Lactococcus fujiensis]|nr:hypothetical protein [Lactococcus fujiensis]
MMYLGIAVGALLSGSLEQINASQAHNVYWIMLIFLFFSVIGLIFGAETLHHRTKGFWDVLKPRILIPQKTRPIALASSIILIMSWAMGGYFQSYSSLIAGEIYHQSGSLTAALILLTYMVCNAVGISLGERFENRNLGELVGVLMYVGFVGSLVLSLYIKSIPLCSISIVGAGIGQGIGYSSALQKFLKKAKPFERAGLLSFIFLIAYGGAGLVTFVSGRLTRLLSFTQITFCFFAWLAILGLASLIILFLENRKLKHYKV